MDGDEREELACAATAGFQLTKMRAGDSVGMGGLLMFVGLVWGVIAVVALVLIVSNNH